MTPKFNLLERLKISVRSYEAACGSFDASEESPKFRPSYNDVSRLIKAFDLLKASASQEAINEIANLLK